MAPLRRIEVGTLPLERFLGLVGPRRAAALVEAIVHARRVFAGRIVWNVNSTAAGGGVAEMLQTLVSYARGAGVDARWLVIGGTPEFFRITKRLHNHLHDAPGDGGPLGPEEQARYAASLAPVAEALAAEVRPGDFVLLHDPQTAGLAPALRRRGAIVVWRCHIGHDFETERVAHAWRFLRPWLDEAHAFVFSRLVYAPAWLRQRPLHVVPPSIDPFSAKNLGMHSAAVRAIVAHIGLGAPDPDAPAPSFLRHDGSQGRVARRAHVVCEGGPVPLRAPLVVQVSRWDRLKDMHGVMRGFVAHTATHPAARLALVGPDVAGVSDDPEGATVYAECLAAWRTLPEPARRRVALVTLPMEDIEENGAMVNAIQRRATIVVQKSLQEGFGLTVTEAMWKSRPIVASAVGGIPDQIAHERHGLLVDDPRDLDAFGRALCRLLENPLFARRLGMNARRRCITHFTSPRHLTQYVDILAQLAEGDRPARAN